MNILEEILTRDKAGKESDIQTNVKLEAMRRRIENLADLPSHAEIIEILNGYYSPTQGEDAYKRLFEKMEEDGKYKEGRYEIVTQELISEIASYLMAQREELGIGGRPLNILELGAGDGKFAVHLAMNLDANSPGDFVYRAIDNGSYGIKAVPFVECRDVIEVVEAGQPDVVIMVWPPYDWTPVVREQETVRECILIGDPRFCGVPPPPGSPYGAYGRSLVHGRDLRPDLWPEDAVWTNVGFSYKWLDDISRIQLGFSGDNRNGCSKTLSFRR
jgi:hypothetical protein